jgi:hypothetical protein
MTSPSTLCGGDDTGRPLVAGTLRGFRTWHPLSRWASVPERALPLAAVTRRHVIWTPTLIAYCSPPKRGALDHLPSTPPPNHPAPSVGCSCGIYAWYEPDDIYIVNAGVFGTIEASGVILVGERGFRAQRARITAVLTCNRRLSAACAEAGIAVYRRRCDLVRDQPPEDVASLLDDRPAPDRA